MSAEMSIAIVLSVFRNECGRRVFRPWAFVLDDEFTDWGVSFTRRATMQAWCSFSVKSAGRKVLLFAEGFWHTHSKSSALTRLLLGFPQLGQGSQCCGGLAFAKRVRLRSKTSASSATGSSEAAEGSEWSQSTFVAAEQAHAHGTARCTVGNDVNIASIR